MTERRCRAREQTVYACNEARKLPSSNSRGLHDNYEYRADYESFRVT